MPLYCESDPNINLVENYLRDGRLLLTLKNKHLLLLLQQKKSMTLLLKKEFTYIRKVYEDMVMEKHLFNILKSFIKTN